MKQYHEVSLPIAVQAVRDADAGAIAAAFHVEHQRMYGYSLEESAAPIELINVRLRAIGVTEKPVHDEQSYAGPDAAGALKGERKVYIPEDRVSRSISVYDGHKTRFGNRIAGPALIEQVNTTLFLSAAYDCICDKYGSFVVFQRGQEDRLASAFREIVP